MKCSIILSHESAIVVEFEQLSPQQQAQYGLFFQYVLGLTRDVNASIWKSKDQLDEITSLEYIQKIREYLEIEDIPYQLGNTAQSLIDKAIEERERFSKISTREPTSGQTVLNRLQGRFLRSLKHHQLRAVGTLLSAENGANFSVPGSGKTTVSLAMYSMLEQDDIVDSLLVVGPTSSFMVWEHEFESCFGYRPKTARLQGPKRDFFYNHPQSYNLFVISYMGLANDLERLKQLCTNRKIMLILDESHHAKKFRGGSVSESAIELAPYARRRMVLSGTPMPQSVSDLWSQFTFLWPSEQLLGGRDGFFDRFVVNEDVGGVRQLVQPFFVRVKKAELELPPENIEFERVQMARYQGQIYDALARQFIADLPMAPTERAQLRQWRRARIIRLMQAASNPSLITRPSREFRVPPLEPGEASVIDLARNYPDFEFPAKLATAGVLADRLVEEGNKVVIWTSFIGNLKPLSDLLSHHGPVILYGGIPTDPDEDAVDSREKRVTLFRESPEHRVLIAIPAACGESLSLHRVARHSIFVDRTFKASEHIQARDRIHRVGLQLDEDVTHHVLLAEQTVDEVIEIRLREKIRRMEALFEEDLPRVALGVPEDKNARASFSDTPNDEEIDFDAVVEFTQMTLSEVPHE